MTQPVSRPPDADRAALVEYLRTTERREEPAAAPAHATPTERAPVDRYTPGGPITDQTVCKMGCHGADVRGRRYENAAERAQLEALSTAATLATGGVGLLRGGAALVSSGASRLSSAFAARATAQVAPATAQAAPAVSQAASAVAPGAARVAATAADDVGALAGRRIGHTFSKHGSENTAHLTELARRTGIPQGQWVNNRAAGDFIASKLPELRNGARTVELPPGIGRIINPDGTITAATQARLHPSMTGVSTAYPLSPAWIPRR